MICGSITYTHSSLIYTGESYWGRGIMTEALSLFMAYVWRTNPLLTRIEAKIFGFNLASANVVRKVGFTHEATLRNYYFKNGAFCDALIYSLLRAP